MNHLNQLSLAIMLGTVFLFASCTGKQGETGAPGNANVISGTTTLNSGAQWSWSNSNGEYYVDIIVPALNSDILYNGAIEVFVNTDGTGSTWKALPYTVISGSTNYGWNYVAAINQVEVDFAWAAGVQGGDPNTTYQSSAINIRTVCIAASARKVYPNIDYTNYQQLKMTFNLKD